MLPHCKRWVEQQGKNSDSHMSGYCAGVLATLGWIAPTLEQRDRFCAPDGVTNGQGGLVVVGYLEKHPGKLHLDFKQLALDAFKEAGPCRETR
jgi:hypothetical protein